MMDGSGMGMGMGMGKSMEGLSANRPMIRQHMQGMPKKSDAEARMQYMQEHMKKIHAHMEMMQRMMEKTEDSSKAACQHKSR